jgi:hypothetical protein
MLTYPHLEQLDLASPFAVWSRLKEDLNPRLAWKNTQIVTDSGVLRIVPDVSFAQRRQADIG